jgi:hypothetical protein
MFISYVTYKLYIAGEVMWANEVPVFMRLLLTSSTTRHTPDGYTCRVFVQCLTIITLYSFKCDRYNCDSYKIIPSPALHCALVPVHRTCHPSHACVHVCASCDGHASVGLVRSLSCTLVHQCPVNISLVCEVVCMRMCTSSSSI